MKTEQAKRADDHNGMAWNLEVWRTEIQIPDQILPLIRYLGYRTLKGNDPVSPSPPSVARKLVPWWTVLVVWVLRLLPKYTLLQFFPWAQFLPPEHERNSSLVPDPVNAAKSIFPTSLWRLPPQPEYTLHQQRGIDCEALKVQASGPLTSTSPRRVESYRMS